jgi:regulator of replication initiation timing
MNGQEQSGVRINENDLFARIGRLVTMNEILMAENEDLKRKLAELNGERQKEENTIQ